MSKDRATCPECGCPVTIPIAYGLPSVEMGEAQSDDEIAIGGCVITMDGPDRECLRCAARFNSGMPAIVSGSAYVTDADLRYSDPDRLFRRADRRQRAAALLNSNPIGKTVEVITDEECLTGTFIGGDDGTVALRSGDREVRVNREAIRSVRLIKR